MEDDRTTPPLNEPGKRARRHQQRRRRMPERVVHRPHPLWQEPLRGALYAAGGSAITLLTTWVQHWR